MTTIIHRHLNHITVVAALYIASIILFPVASVYGQEQTSTSTDSTPTTTTQTTPGPQEPTGADANTYEYNPETGLWENDYYTWDPVTRLTAPKTEQRYSYNPETGRWDTTEWVYAPELGRYVKNIVISTTGPNSTNTATGGGGDTSIAETGPNSSTSVDGNSGSINVDGSVGEGAKTGNNSISQTGPDSQNSIENNSTYSGMYDLFFNANISNNINSTATSGDAAVTNNTYGGSATSGDASVLSNLINMLQSSWDPTGSGINTFVSTIDGDLVGDLKVDPGQIGGTNPIQTEHSYAERDFTLNVKNDATIDNNLDLKATSGDATVSNNTTGGDAKTGDASVIANLINMINSTISAGGSFVGVLNVNGDFEGDVLLPDGYLEQMLANNKEPAVITGDTEIDLDRESNISINNNINTDATAGEATVASNTTGGNATTGSATSDVTLLNLTGSQVIGANSIVVFVNVLGEWVGLIVGAPAGTNAAVLGGGIESAGYDLRNTTVDANITNDFTINNNLNLTAETGDATVSNNTTGGNATTGNASVAANILNISNTQFSLTDWFGVLFINVAGNWFGSFGVDTPYGNPSVGGKGGGSGTGTGSSGDVLSYQEKAPTNNPTSRTPTTPATAFASLLSGSSEEGDSGDDVTVNEITSSPIEQTAQVDNPVDSGNANWALIIGSTIGIVLILGGERILAAIRSRFN
jgi:hypothetical protein